MNKKIIALLLVAAIAVSGVFALGIGGMSSNITGYGSLTIAPDGQTGCYFGVGYGPNLNVSFEYKFWNWNIIDEKVFDWGLHAGLGGDVGIGFVNAFSLSAGVYGFFGTNFMINLDRKLAIEFFGQWQPNFTVAILPNFYVSNSWASYIGAGAGGIRFWF